MLVPHVAAGLGVPPGTDHGGLHVATPPIAAATDTVLHHGQQGLLQALGHRAMGCNTRWPPPPAVSHLGATGHSLGRGHSLVPYIVHYFWFCSIRNLCKSGSRHSALISSHNAPSNKY